MDSDGAAQVGIQHEPKAPRPLDRLWLIGLLVVLVGLPALVAVQLMGARSGPAPLEGSQPGGPVEVHVVNREGRPYADCPVSLHLAADGEVQDALLVARTDPEGVARFQAPPHDGVYVARLVDTATSAKPIQRSVSFLSRDGGTVESAVTHLVGFPADR